MYVSSDGGGKPGSAEHDEALMAACRKMWDNMVDRRMYITGGIGSTYYGEAFTVGY